MTIGVYQITNKVNGKSYIGSSIQIESRWVEHRYLLNKGSHHSPKLQNAWTKYGEDSFEFRILQITSEKNVRIAEQQWMDVIDCVNTGYNVAPSSDISDYHRSPEILKKLSESHKNPSPELRERMRLNRLGKSMTTEAKKNLSDTMKRLVDEGVLFTEEHRAKLSHAAKNRTPEHQEKLRKSLTGKKLSQATKDKLSKAHKGKQLSDEHKEKLRKTSLESWAKKKSQNDVVSQHKEKLKELLTDGNKYTNAKLGELMGISHWRVMQIKKEMKDAGLI